MSEHNLTLEQFSVPETSSPRSSEPQISKEPSQQEWSIEILDGAEVKVLRDPQLKKVLVG